ncbi:hypothetical protein [Halomarina litorea]|uniref:hypothetical protein n=1 Tax=Halomarina litorea TaxID=2961595 RepID=UPI0020C3753B|nr:hypothetical protein [Halomarina sp. BCD28]
MTVVYVTDPPEDAILNTYSAEDTSNPHLERALDVEPLSNGSGTVSKYIVQSENASASEDAFARYNYSKTANGTDVSGYYFERDGHVFAVTWITFV